MLSSVTYSLSAVRPRLQNINCAFPKPRLRSEEQTSHGRLVSSWRYFFRAACQFSITVYGSGPLFLATVLGTATRKRRPSVVQSHLASPTENPRGRGFPGLNSGLVAIWTAIGCPS